MSILKLYSSKAVLCTSCNNTFNLKQATSIGKDMEILFIKKKKIKEKKFEVNKKQFQVNFASLPLYIKYHH